MIVRLLRCLLALLAALPAAAQGFSGGDRINLATAMAIADAHGPPRWPGLKDAPKATLLIAPAAQAVVCPFAEPEPAEGYEPRAPLAGCAVFVKATPYRAGRVKAMTTGGARPLVIVGSPYTAEPFPLWIGIWLHEHFHQFQMAAPGYRAAAEGLGLAAPGDGRGRWMVDFAFPFGDTADAFADAARALAAALDAPAPARLASYLDARQRFFGCAGARAGRYAAFVAWQEGVANAFEIDQLKAAAADPAAVGAPVAPAAYDALAARLTRRMMEKLARPDLPGDQRLAFYAQGYGEARLLDRLTGCGESAAAPGCWRADYQAARFDLGPLLKAAAQRGP